MPELLQNYSVEQIIIFIIIFAIAIKECVDFADWIRGKFNGMVENRNKRDDLKRDVDKIEHTHEEDMKKLYEIQVSQNKAIDELTQSVELLLKSDKDEIKAWITDKHHYFVYELKYIDDYSLDCIERRYAHYQEEGGNSFVADLMEDIRNLEVTCSQQAIHSQNK